MKKNFLNIRIMTLTAVMTAIICIVSPFSVPVGLIPISFCNFMLCLAVTVFGGKIGTLCCVLYLLIGGIGVPVFSGFMGGVGRIIGPTGGYLIGYIPMTVLAGLTVDRTDNRLIQILGMILATALMYVFGSVWLSKQAGIGFYEAVSVGVAPFVVWDIVKIVVGVMIGRELKKQLKKSGILKQY